MYYCVSKPAALGAPIRANDLRASAGTTLAPRGHCDPILLLVSLLLRSLLLQSLLLQSLLLLPSVRVLLLEHKRTLLYILQPEKPQGTEQLRAQRRILRLELRHVRTDPFELSAALKPPRRAVFVVVAQQ